MKRIDRRKLISLLLLVLLVVGSWVITNRLEGGESLPTDGDQYAITESNFAESDYGYDAQIHTSTDHSDVSADTDDATEARGEEDGDAAPIDEDGSYTTRDDVALYLHTYGRLPDNFITKDEARDLGWPGGGLEDYAPGCCIGGDKFGNREGLLPSADGRQYYECDIDTLGADSRGAKRIVYSNDGLIFYTDDHYESFTLLYGDISG